MPQEVRENIALPLEAIFIAFKVLANDDREKAKLALQKYTIGLRRQHLQLSEMAFGNSSNKGFYSLAAADDHGSFRI